MPTVSINPSAVPIQRLEDASVAPITVDDKILALNGITLKEIATPDLRAFAQDFSNTLEFANNLAALQGGVKHGSLYRLPLTGGIVSPAIAWGGVQSFTAGRSTIAFTPSLSPANSFDVAFKITPDSVQLPQGDFIVDYQYQVRLELATNVIYTNDGNASVDSTINTGANGAGVYIVQQIYNTNDGYTFDSKALYHVDALGNILHSFEIRGVNVTSVNGLQVSVEAEIVQNGVSYNDFVWISLDNSSYTPIQIGTGNPANLTLLPDTYLLAFIAKLGTEFTTDFNNSFLNSNSIFVII